MMTPSRCRCGRRSPCLEVRTIVIMAMLRGLRLATGAAVACGLLALALTEATGQRAKPCDVVEPDSLGISWTAPCDEGRWLLDPQSGCRIWDWRPAPEDTSTWTGTCTAGRKEKGGVVQWFEHGDRSIASRASTAAASAKALAATIGRPGNGSRAPTPTTCPTDVVP
jgi:hypothetical protein